jgi:hypothetical protein
VTEAHVHVGDKDPKGPVPELVVLESLDLPVWREAQRGAEPVVMMRFPSSVGPGVLGGWLSRFGHSSTTAATTTPITAATISAFLTTRLPTSGRPP